MNSNAPQKRLLLHACCAPCAVYVHHLLSQSYQVTCFFYNDNIQPKEEYEFRRNEIERIARIQNWDLLFGPYEPENWDEAITGLEDEPERGNRCSVCFRQRLNGAFRIAVDLNYDIVTTTLSISPYKKADQINREGEQLSEKFSIPFLSENFKKNDGYTKSRKMALELGIRHQNYCGCLFSKADRMRRLEKKQASQEESIRSGH